MNANIRNDVEADTRNLAAAVLVESARAALPPTRVDFAVMLGDHLLVYGWILGLRRLVAGAELRYGGEVIGLLDTAVPVPRPDVTQHFAATFPAADDEHGFCVLVGLPAQTARPSYLRLSATLHSGESLEGVWPVATGADSVVELLQKYRSVLTWLGQHLQPPDAARLRELWDAVAPAPMAAPAPAAALGADPHQSNSLPFAIEACVTLQRRLLVVLGWMHDRDLPLLAARVRTAEASVDVLESVAVAAPIGRDEHPLSDTMPRRFSAVCPLPEPLSDATEAVVEVFGALQTGWQHKISTAPLAARRELSRALQSLEPDTAVALLERIAGRLGDEAETRSTVEWLGTAHAQAVARLPNLLPSAENARCSMHVDLVIPVAGQGVFLSGWYYEIPGTVRQVSCRAGVYEFRMDGTWLRTARADVSTHLSSSRIASSHHNHGFGCFVPLPEAHAPYYIAITFTDGTVQRMGLPLPSPATALQNVRAVLTAFPPACRELRRCLDEHVGPAVRGIWQSRPRLQPSLIIDRFGAAPAHPRVSIIVPLYGRHDLADYQLALFADDPDLQNAELIYVVDDPAIYDEFRALCAGLYEIHRVPFTLAYAGVNLGFAGATNCGASIARAGRLLLLNSDVLPKQPGWLGKLLSVFESLEAPGPLGVKLLFEDGGLQHAGMAFRRYAPWDGLWINDHPQKGHSASGLTGVRTVDAVTAACMLVETALYRELGGLSEDYVIGDFEDSDFCLRAAAAGHRSRVALDVELYHLERQSQNLIGDAQWRANLTLYNCWQHNLRWAAQIEALQ